LLSIRQGSGARVLDYLSTAGIEFMTALLGSEEADQHSLLRDLSEVRLVVGSAICHHSIDNFARSELEAIAEAVEALEEEAAGPSPSVPRLQELDFQIQSLIARAGGNRAFILLHNTISHVYGGIAPLFAPLVERPRTIAAHYRKMLTALQRGDAKEAKRAVTRVFVAGRDAMIAAYPPEREEA
jgi:DNA-binding FadR family transcriptional regulator